MFERAAMVVAASLGPGSSLSVPLPEHLAQPGDAAPRGGGPAVVYLNLDGATLDGNGEDSRTNSSFLAGQHGFTGPYPAWGGTPAQRQAFVDAVRADWAPFDVVITDARPGSGNYTMAMHGPAAHPFGGGVVGIAPVDCFDQNPNNIVFGFYSAGSLDAGGPLGEQATTISQEIAHSFGLEHVNGNGAQADIMYPTTSSNASFLDTCFPITGNYYCADQHAQLSGCGAGNVQSSFQELYALFGSANPDTADPNVTIVSPADGADVEVGADFQIVVEATDDVEVANVELFVNGHSAGVLTSPPYTWAAVDVPAGSHELYAIATDPSAHQAESPVVTIHAGESGGSGDPLPGDGLPPGFGEERDDGCGCGVDGGRAASALVLLALPVLRRRRRQ